MGGVELHVVLKSRNLLSNHEHFITKIYFVTNFNIFTKFLNHENLELYGISALQQLLFLVTFMFLLQLTRFDGTVSKFSPTGNS